MKKPERAEGWLNFFDSLIMYISCLAGVLSSKYVPMLIADTAIAIDISWGRFAISCGVALAVLTFQEQSGDQEKKRRSKRFHWRIGNAYMWGVAFHRFIGG